MEKGLYIKTYGCQSNVYDSQKIIDTEGRVEKFSRKYNLKNTQS